MIRLLSTMPITFTHIPLHPEPHRKLNKIRLACSLTVIFSALNPVLTSAAQGTGNDHPSSPILEQTEQRLKQSMNHQATIQTKIDKLDAETRDNYLTYIQTEKQAAQLEAYNIQLEKLVTAQGRELLDLEQQIRSLAETEQSALPLLVKMHSMLARFIAEDQPFLPREREKRLARLEEQLNRSDISIAEKYRQVLEAYQIEVDYGRTIEAYQGALDHNTNVTFLKLGRLALYYQTADGKRSGMWNPKQQNWTDLAEEHNWAIKKAIQQANGQTVPELLPLPLSGLSDELLAASQEAMQ
ncbi:MAG: DUF3450 domain-containing protein [Pseudomonadales bacterium]|nr:DUF3450 domain-containing protein [Pseudomonadales bacterium]